MDGRLFGGLRVVAYISDGSERFKKSGGKKAMDSDEEEEEQRRLDKFGDWLEAQE